MQESGSPAELSLAQRESSGAAMESFIGGRQRCLGAMQFFIETMHRFVCVRQASVGAMEFSVKGINRFVCARQAPAGARPLSLCTRQACARSSASRVQERHRRAAASAPRGPAGACRARCRNNAARSVLTSHRKVVSAYRSCNADGVSPGSAPIHGRQTLATSGLPALEFSRPDFLKGIRGRRFRPGGARPRFVARPSDSPANGHGKLAVAAFCRHGGQTFQPCH